MKRHPVDRLFDALFLFAGIAAVMTLLMMCAHAGEARLSWSAPTARVDGTPLAPSEIAGYRALWGTTSRAYTEEQVVDGLELEITGLLAGTWYFAVTAIDTAGLESAPSAEVSKTIEASPEAPPVPPSAVVVGGPDGSPQLAYVIVQSSNRIALVPVGTVPPGTPCDPQQVVRDSNGVTGFVVPASSVTWTGTARRSVVVAECG